jgi:ATP-binding cassette subfamily C protein
MKSLKTARSQFRGIIILLAAFSLIVNLLLLTMPLYMLQIYDRVLPSQSMDTLKFLSVIAVAALVVLGLLEAIRAIVAARAAAKLEVQLGADAVRVAMLSSRLGEANVQPVRDLAAVRSFIASRAVFALLDLPFAPLFIGILYFIHPTLFYITVAGAVILFAIAILNQMVTKTPSENASQLQGAAFATAQSIARNSESLRAMGMTGNGISVWGNSNAESMSAQGSVDTRNAVLSGISKTIRMGLQIAILGVGALLVLRGEMTAGMIFASSIISGRGLQPIDQVIGGWKQYVTSWRSWKNLTAILEKAGDESEKISMPKPNGNISVEAALVMPAGGGSREPILNRVSFSVNAGDVVGIVGPSGSGKSTMARLLVGAQFPSAGTVRIDGTDIQNWDALQLGKHIGYLGQGVELLPGTIAENIARLSLQPDDVAVHEAARKAQVHELIQNLPQGYDTRVGPGGLGLSGGQKQRIALARAFYGDPEIMVLDEPNANLDDDGEMALQLAFRTARKSGTTVIVITQRKQILNDVDKILRLHRGKVDFYGTREKFVQALQEMRAKRAAQAKAVQSAQSGNQPPVKVN